MIWEGKKLENRTLSFDEFHFLLGQTVMFCQIVEWDVKRIYCAMRRGDIVENFETLKAERWTLGETLAELQKLDYSDNRPYLSLDDYAYLRKLTGKRNHWCHEAYINFVYLGDDFSSSKEYKKECRWLIEDNRTLTEVYKKLEQVRLKAMHDFKRN